MNKDKVRPELASQVVGEFLVGVHRFLGCSFLRALRYVVVPGAVVGLYGLGPRRGARHHGEDSRVPFPKSV